MSSTFLKPGVQVVPCPAKEPHATEDGGQVTGGTAVYSIVVIRRRVEGRKTELYCSHFLLDQNLLTEPSGDTCEAYLRKVVRDFLMTDAGKLAYENTCREFNWGDVETEIPDDFFSAYGLTHWYGRPGIRNFLCCGAIGILVDQDELLGREVFEDSVYQNGAQKARAYR